MGGRRERARGGCGLSYLVKQKIKGKNYALLRRKKNFFIYIYDVIVKQIFYKRSTNYYC
jgi:hypothetical protein